MEAKLRFFPLVIGIFVTTLIVSNIIAVKLVDIFGLLLPAAVILFPLAYIFGDILTEVYGFVRARQVIWIGFFSNLLAVAAIWIAGILPPAAIWTANVYSDQAGAQQAYQAILGFTPRLLMASFLAYLAGEYLNSYVLARLKVRTEGRYLWLRTITSTIVGQGVDSLLFLSIAFWGILPGAVLGEFILTQWGFKVLYEVLATPLTYWIVNSLKRVEGVDVFDRDLGFRHLK